jgi:hypothetical protein
MTNSEKAALVQQHDSPNWARIKSLVSDGMDWDTAEHVDELERREAVLTQLGAAGELSADQRDELDTIQTELLELVGSPHETFVGTTFVGDGATSGDGAPPALDVEDTTSEPTRMTSDELEDLRDEQRRAQRLACDFLNRHADTGDEAALRIAQRYASEAGRIEERIDDGFVQAIRGRVPSV